MKNISLKYGLLDLRSKLLVLTNVVNVIMMKCVSLKFCDLMETVNIHMQMIHKLWISCFDRQAIKFVVNLKRSKNWQNTSSVIFSISLWWNMSYNIERYCNSRTWSFSNLNHINGAKLKFPISEIQEQTFSFNTTIKDDNNEIEHLTKKIIKRSYRLA